MAEALDGLLAELVAGGCGDWDRLEARWTLKRCEAMRAHWARVAPPAHVSLAALAGFRPAAEPGSPSGDQPDDPETLAQRLRALGVLA